MLCSLGIKLQQFFDTAKLDMLVHAEVSNPPYYSFELKLGAKGRIKKLRGCLEEIGIHLGSSTPFLQVKNAVVYLELLNGPHPVQNFSDMVQRISFNSYRAMYRLPILLGTTEVTKPLVVDLASMPHLLIAGTTGSGKSTCLHAIIQSLIMQAEKPAAGGTGIDFVLIDPKRVEFNGYERIRYLKEKSFGIISEPHAAIEALRREVDNMEKRLERFRQFNCRNLDEFRAKGGHVNYTVIVIDELASLMKDRTFEHYLGILGAKGRAAGYCLIACTQYPHSKVVSSTITTHFDGRIAFRMQTPQQSIVVLQETGAESLQGKGDGLFTYAGQPMQRFHGVYCNSNSDIVSQYSVVPAVSVVERLLKFF